MRSVLSMGSAVWFFGGSVFIGDGSSGLMGDQVIGDPTAMALHLIARVLFVGLGTFVLAFVDWRAVVAWLRS